MFSLFLSLASLVVGAALSAADSASAKNQADKTLETQKDLTNQQLELEKETAEKNFGLQQEQFEYQKELNQIQMQREDTAMQRQVADLKAAGLSPLMASGGSSTGQYLSAPAAQFNSSGISNAISNMLGIHTDYASRKQAAYQFERQMHLQTAQSVADLTSLKLDNDFKREQIKAQKIANAYNEEHGLRDPSLQQAVVDFVMDYLHKNNINPAEMAQTKLEQVKEGVKTKLDEVEHDLKTGSRNTKAGRVIQNVINVPKTAVSDTISVGKQIKESGKKIWNKTKTGVKSVVSKAYNWYKSKRGK